MPVAARARAQRDETLPLSHAHDGEFKPSGGPRSGFRRRADWACAFARGWARRLAIPVAALLLCAAWYARHEPFNAHGLKPSTAQVPAGLGLRGAREGCDERAP